jgi:FkbM family methyltransferase
LRLSGSHVSYGLKNYDTIGETKKNLLKKLDPQSISMVELFISRCEYIYNNSLIETNKFIESELLEQRTCKDEYKNIYPEMPYNESCFRFHNGLTFLSKKEIDYIKGKDCLDLGAFIGDSSAIFSRKYEFKKVYAFEPENNNFQILKQNIQKYNLTNVEPVNLGVADKSGLGVISDKSDASSLDNSEGKTQIAITSIDEFVSSRNLNVGVIKMDIEGSEYKAVSGAIETIKKQKPILLLAIYHTGKDFFEIKPLIESIDAEYNFKIKKLNSHHLILETFLIAYPKIDAANADRQVG